MTVLTGRVMIVTGAGKGLGQAYAIYLARQGASVLVNNRRHPGEQDNDTSAMKTVKLIRADGGIAEPNFADTTDPHSGMAMIDQAINCFGDVHGVVANAGIERLGRFESLSDDDFNNVFQTSFFGNLYLVRAAWKHWCTTGFGRAVLTTSGAGLYGNHGQVAYSAAKAAVVGLTEALAIEGRSKNIVINALAPYAYTAMTRAHINSSDAARLSPDKIAPLVAYLVSDACSISGETLVAAGGYVRRAYTREGPTLPLGNNVAATLSELLASEGPSFNTATASFEHFFNTIRTHQRHEDS